MELSAIWVVVIVMIGIAIGVYSICKGCQGLREQSAQAIAQLQERTVARNSSNGQNSGSGSDSNLFSISGSSVHDKNPPNYDEIMEPPPSYEETIKLHGAACYPVTAAVVDETSAQVNYAFTGSQDDVTSSQSVETSNDSSPSAHQSTSNSPSTDTSVASCSVKHDS